MTTEGEIRIFAKSSLWDQLEGHYKYTYSASNLSLDTLKEALTEYLYKKQDNE
jgi:hypothetical protein